MDDKIKTLTDLPNIGKTIAELLINAEIDTPKKLYEMGAEKAFLKLVYVNKKGCLNMLMSLAGAVRGVKFGQLPIKERKELKEFYDQIKNDECINS